MTARRPTWGGGRRSFTGFAVEPLDPRESLRLVELLLDGGIGEQERAAIVARAEGNPFFLEEIVRTRGVDMPSAADLPDTVHAALAARVDLLPSDEKRVLQTAAVVGRVFWPGAVAEVAGLDSGAVHELLDRLQDRDLVLGRLSSSMSGQRELIFKHALICEVAYESLPRRDRVRMHRGVADWVERTFAGRRDEVVELIAHHRAAAYRVGATEELRAAAFDALADAAEGAYARAGFEQALGLGREALDLAATPLDRARVLEVIGHASFVTFDGSTAWESLRAAADIVRSAAPDDRARLAYICGLAVMIPTRAQGLMRTQPSAEEVLPYLELGLACAGNDDSEALALMLASQGFWDFGFGIDARDERGERARHAAERSREVARRLGRPDLELIALDALNSGMNIRGLYGLAQPFDRERLEICRSVVRDPFEVSDSFYTAAWSSFEVGLYRDTVALVDEFRAIGVDLAPMGPLSLAVLARVPLGDWDEALDNQAQIRELLGEAAARPPSFASGGYGAEVFIHDARGNRAAADAALAEMDEWAATEERTRRWPIPLVAVTYARRGDFAAAHGILELLVGRGIYRVRELEVRCLLIAEEGAWEEAGAVIAEARRHAEVAGILALPLHADRLEGRALLAAGDADRALGLLGTVVAGFARLGAAWERALTELPLGEAYAALGRDDDAAQTVARAAREFERLRVPRELEQARALLDGLSTSGRA